MPMVWLYPGYFHPAVRNFSASNVNSIKFQYARTHGCPTRRDID